MFNTIPNDKRTDCQYFFDYFAKLGEIQSYSDANFLSEGDIKKVEKLIQNFENFLFELPNPRITPKCQILLRHVIPFVKQHFFWGKASEQSIESLHGRINNDLRRLTAIKDKRQLYLQLAETLCINNFVFDS